MGNEMGNRNVSGLQEEDNTAVEASEKSLQEAVHEDVKGENQIIPAAEGKDYHEKVAGLDSDNPPIVEDFPTDNETSDRKGHGEAEVQPVDTSPKDQVESNDAGGEESGIQLSPSSQYIKDHERPVHSKSENIIETSDPEDQKQILEKLIGSNSEESESETGDHHIQKEMSTTRETEKEQDDTRTSSFDTNSVPHSSELLESAESVADQHELAISHADPFVEFHTGSPQGSTEVQGSNITDNDDDNSDLLDTEIPCSVAGCVVSDSNVGAEMGEGELLATLMASQEEEMVDICINKEKFDITDGNDAGIEVIELTLNTLSSSENKTNGELSTEMNINWNDSSGSPLEAIPLANSLKSHEDISEIEDKCMVLTEETKLVKSGSEVGNIELRPAQFYDECLTADTQLIGNALETNEIDENPLQFCDELVNESITTDEVSTSESMKFEINHMCKGNESGGKSPNLAPEEHCKDSEGEAEMASEIGKAPTELTVTDCDLEREETIEKKIVEERVEIEEDAHAIGEDTEGIEVTEDSVSQSPAIKQDESLLSQSPAIGSEYLQRSKIMSVEAMSFAVELEKETPWKDLSQYNEKNQVKMSDSEIPAGAKHFNEQCVESQTSICAGGAYETRDSMEWLRIDQSNSQKLNLPIQIRRSPSFNFDLLVEARAEENDQTPLLYQDKPATRSFSSRIDANITKPIPTTDYSQCPLKFQVSSVEEKAIPRERNNSERSRTPFLSLMKEDEEAQILIAAQRNDTSPVAAKKAPEELPKSHTDEGATSITSSRRREKRKSRSSLFTNCMCCAAVIN